MNPYAAQIYIDGSCYNNPGGPGGLAGLIEMPDASGEPVMIFQEGYRSTTNNRMELWSFIKTLDYIKNNAQRLREEGVNQVEIWSDSQGNIVCNQLVEEWRSASWLGRNGNPIANVDLIKRILTLKNSIGFSYQLHHIANKSTEITKAVDKLAKQAAKRPIKDDDGFMPSRICQTNVHGGTAPLDARGQKLKIKIFSHPPVSRIKGSLYKVKFEITNGDHLEKYYAYCSQEVDSLLHRHHYYEAQFNCNKRNPLIEEAKEVEK